MAPMTLSGTEKPLTECFDVALLDLDGVVYVGNDAVTGVPQALATVRAQGMRLAFVTNNAARPPRVVADHLTALGVPAAVEEVITSSQAAAHYLADRLPAGSAVLVVGTVGLDEALRERGLVAVYSADDDPAAVVQGFSPELSWPQLAEGAVAIRRGLPWIATNIDATIPSPRGPVPGNGSLVAALERATGARPVMTGKPDPTMHRESVERSGAERPIVVGDRLDTDVEGASAVGCPSLLVLSGVTSPADLLAARERLRPSYLAHDASGLLVAHRAPVVDDDSASCGEWRAAVEREGGLRLSRLAKPTNLGHGGADTDDSLDALRALCAAAWSRDGASEPRCGASDAAAEAALRDLHLI